MCNVLDIVSIESQAIIHHRGEAPADDHDHGSNSVLRKDEQDEKTLEAVQQAGLDFLFPLVLFVSHWLQ